MASGSRWEVIGGGSSGGIVVRKEKDVKSVEESQRLSTGALVDELALDGERLHYRILSGNGPESGWISTKFRDKDLVVRTDKEPPPKLWEVVGGEASGGILVRSGKDTSSTSSGRLGTGSIIKQVALEDDRLCYELLEGMGPEAGWVSVKLKDKDLVIRTDKKPNESAAMKFIKLLRGHEDADYAAMQEMLPKLGEDTQAVIEMLDRCSSDEDAKVSRKSLRALALLGDTSSIIKCLTSASDPYKRAEAALLLGDVAKEGSSALRQALAQDSWWLVRCWAARSLSHLPKEEVEKARQDLTVASKEDKSVDVREAASMTLRRLDGDDSLAIAIPPSDPPKPLSGRKLRILAIHGAAANAKILKVQVSGFKAALGSKDTEWFFVDSPLVWQPIPGSKDPLFSERTDGEKLLAGGDPFRWWYSHGNAVYSLVEDSLTNFRQLLAQHEPIDVVVSFSQGSNMMSMVLDSYRRDGLPVPWAVTAMFSGGQIDDRLWRLQPGWRSPHPIVRSYNAANDDWHHGGEPSLSEMYSDITEFAHSDGHGFPKSQPRAKEIFTAMAAEILKRCGLDAIS